MAARASMPTQVAVAGTRSDCQVTITVPPQTPEPCIRPALLGYWNEWGFCDLVERVATVDVF